MSRGSRARAPVALASGSRTGTLRTMIRAAWNLFLLGCKTGFKLNGPYWTWRRETGFGVDPAKMPSAAERRHAMLEYGAWVGQMRALRKR